MHVDTASVTLLGEEAAPGLLWLLAGVSPFDGAGLYFPPESVLVRIQLCVRPCGCCSSTVKPGPASGPPTHSGSQHPQELVFPLAGVSLTFRPRGQGFLCQRDTASSSASLLGGCVFICHRPREDCVHGCGPAPLHWTLTGRRVDVWAQLWPSNFFLQVYRRVFGARFS